jgi:inositol-phosphate phosphatase/L-galactose 1-phosphate phosphatase/histidinol-phosphatase
MSQQSACPRELVDFAAALADAVGAVHRRHFRRPVAVDTKADGTPVTRVDRDSEHVVRELIEHRYPEHGIIGEEFPPLRPGADYVWVIDPLDGTRLFLLGIPQFAVLIALAHQGRFVLGVIDQPIVRDRWVGADGSGTSLNGLPVQTRLCPGLSEAVLCRPGVGDNTLGRDADIDRVAARARWVQWGVMPCDYGLVASGFIDLVVSAGPKLHDLAPLDPIIRNAGGAVTDWQGADLTLASRDTVIAAGDAALIEPVARYLSAGERQEQRP